MRFNLIQPAAITWRDGVPCSDLFDDIYFSSDNGLAESLHVFINGNDLITRFRALGAQDIFVIGELGFGAGLNCLLAWQLFLTHAPKDAKLIIFSAEKHPLAINDLSDILACWPTLTREASALRAAYPVLINGTCVGRWLPRLPVRPHSKLYQVALSACLVLFLISPKTSDFKPCATSSSPKRTQRSREASAPTKQHHRCQCFLGASGH